MTERYVALPLSIYESPAWAKLTKGQADVLIAILKHGDKTQQCWPSIETLARTARISRRTTERAIVLLCEVGIILKISGKGRSKTNHYQVLNPDTLDGFYEGQTPAQLTGIKAVKPVKQRPENPSNSAIKPRRSCRTELLKRTTSRTKGAPEVIPEPLATDRFRVAWAEWQQHRDEIKHPITPTAGKRQLAMLAKLGHDQAIAAIERSIERGWRGLFPPDQDKGNGSTTSLSNCGLDPCEPKSDAEVEALLARPEFREAYR